MSFHCFWDAFSQSQIRTRNKVALALGETRVNASFQERLLGKVVTAIAYPCLLAVSFAVVVSAIKLLCFK